MALAGISLSVSVMTPQNFDGLRAAASDALVPVVHLISQPVRDAAMLVRDMSGISTLQAENARLQAENIKLREWYQTALGLEAENKSLKSLLNVRLDPEYNFITARVMIDTGHAFAKSLMVAAGKKDGAAKGQAAISGEGLVGRIVEVGNNTARVLLITDINSRVPVLIEGSSQHAVLSGNNGPMPALIHLPPETVVEDGARVITSGFGGIFPKGLPVGRVVLDENGMPGVRLFADFNGIVYLRLVGRNDLLGLEVSGN